MESSPPEQPDSDATETGGFRKRWFFGGLGAAIFALIAAVLLGFFLMIGRDVDAPDWVRIRIDARLKEALPDTRVEFGRMALRIEEDDWSPRLYLENVSIFDAAGSPFASLGTLSVRASFEAVLRGELKPRKVSVSGALIRLRRGRDGSFDLSFGSALRQTEAPTLAALIETVDQALELPQLEMLEDLQARALTVLYEDARAGRAWTVDGGRMRLSRAEDQLTLGGDFALLGGQDYAATLEMSYSSMIGSPEAQMGVVLSDVPAQDIASQSPALSWLGALRAPISGALRASVDDTGALGPLNATLQIGEGVVQPEVEALPIPFQSARSYFTFNPKTQALVFDELSVESDWVSAIGDGRATLLNNGDGWPSQLLGQLHLTQIRANPLGFYEDPISLEQASLDIRVRLDPFELDIGQLLLHDAGSSVIMDGSATINETGWDVAADVRAASLLPSQIMKYWPPTLKFKTRNWIETNVLQGTLKKVHVAFRSAQGGRPTTYLTSQFDGASVRFMKTLPPAEDGSGYLELKDDRLLVVAERGFVTAPQGGRIEIAGTHFEIPTVRMKQPPAQVRLNTQSTITAALSMLDQKPFQFLSKAGQSVSLADGRAAASGTIGFALKPKIPANEITFNAEGILRSVRSDTLVSNRTIAADSLKVIATNEGISVAGQGRIGQVPFDGAWTMPLGKPGAGSAVEGTVELSERFIDEFAIGLPPGSVSGKGTGAVLISLQPNSAPRLSLTSNLSGVRLSLAPLGWSKPAARKGTLSVRGVLSTPPSIERLSVKAPGLEASGRVDLNADGSLKDARFSKVVAGNWLNAPITLTGRGKNQAPGIKVGGGRFDMRLSPPSSSDGATAPLAVVLDRLQVTEEIALTDFAGTFTSGGGVLDGNFQARLNGTAPVTGRVMPQGKSTAVQIKSGNAGAVINAAGLLDNAHGGSMQLTLKPKADKGHYDGQLEMTDLRVRDAPAMASLLSAVSGIGILEQMDGNGLMFNDVQSRFRITPNHIIVDQGSATGPSLGLSVDGIYDVARKTMDMQGVISPFFALNGVGSFLTRKGEGLIGFNYTLEGPSSGPSVKVNPLSLFTPGMFREIFRKPPPKVSQ